MADRLVSNFKQLASEVNLQDRDFQIAIASIIFNPTFWNIAARTEYNTHLLTKLAFNKPKFGCYLLALTIFSLGLFRDYLYEKALKNQVSSVLLADPVFRYLGIASFLFGNVLVLSSMWKLGITGTYLGDYFGILMEDRVTSFPFNIDNNPMYNGSTLCFLGTGLYYGKPAGIFASLVVYLMYQVALKFEEPFTAKIYAKREAEREQKKKKSL
ncbi:BA75_03658T0 [Komagataella pastoris]|uniref:Phosphatidyl-N-methylethanolamine N-methyltransferase n=1 Tax=Komagataella pastoris TaxID=4922 RepID=A0A1B2JET0_PICPA|nr:BA75_03658T0 [Komagataella pastoris]